MPTEITVVIPTPGADDEISIADDVGDVVSIIDESERNYPTIYKTNDHKTVGLLAIHTDNPQNEFSSLRDFNDENEAPSFDYDGNDLELLTSEILSPNCSVDHSTNSTPRTDNALDQVSRRLRSAKIEHLLNGSNRSFLAASVEREIHHTGRNKRGAARGHTQEQRHKRVPSKTVHNFSQTNEKNTKLKRSQEQGQAVDIPVINVGDTHNGKRLGVKTQLQRPASSPAYFKRRPVVSEKPRQTRNVHLSVTGTYDIETEHHDIMMKALNSYYQHRYADKPGYIGYGKSCNTTTITNNNHIHTNSRDTNDINNDAEDGVENDNRHEIDNARYAISSEASSENPMKYLSQDNNHIRHHNATLLREILTTCDKLNENKNNSDSEPNMTTNTENKSKENKINLIYDDDKIVARIWTRDGNNGPSRVVNSSLQKSIENRDKDRSTIDHKERPSSSKSNYEQGKMFKLARCRLIYNDEHQKRKTKVRPKSSSWSERASKKLADEATAGVLVDSVGHVYGRSKPRPWSALPCKFSAFLNKSGGSLNDSSIDNRYRDFFQEAISSKEFCNFVRANSTDSSIRRKESSSSTNSMSCSKDFNIDTNPSKADQPQQSLNVVNIKLPTEDTMDHQSNSGHKAVAFNRRNRTTHSWSDAPTMSQSLPNASFLHKQYTTSPPPLTARGASPIRAGKPTKHSKPSSSYSYDGGFFLGAHSTGADYFVIHPDWVSEALTINKIGGCGSPSGPKHPQLTKLKLPQRRWSERRCLSAPPSKFRNPISWEDTDAVQFQDSKNNSTK